VDCTACKNPSNKIVPINIIITIEGGAADVRLISSLESNQFNLILDAEVAFLGMKLLKI
jgi:hypothetical protein